MKSSEKLKENEHEPINGKVEINVNNIYSEATLMLEGAFFGGVPVTTEDIKKRLNSMNIVYGVDYELIDEIVEKKLYNKIYTIASWKPPVNGENGSYKYLVSKTTEKKPKENDKGFVDYRDLGVIRNVKKGFVIAEIQFPTDGEFGIDLTGKTINQKKGVAVKVPHGENIELSSDGTKLIAINDGNLVYRGQTGFAVETTFILSGNLDSSVGNLDFLGDIEIRGEIFEGFKVTAGGSVTVSGNVTGALIEAGKAVTIKKGLINSKVICHGTTKFVFAENSDITSDHDITSEALINCKLYCGGILKVLGGKGVIMGGSCVCLGGLEAKYIGSKSFTATAIVLGDNAVMTGELKELEASLAKIEANILSCTQAIEFLTEKKKQSGLTEEKEWLLTKTIKTKILYGSEKAKIIKRMEGIKNYLEHKQELSLICKNELYPGTVITINDEVLKVNDQNVHCRVTHEKGLITIKPL